LDDREDNLRQEVWETHRRNGRDPGEYIVLDGLGPQDSPRFLYWSGNGLGPYNWIANGIYKTMEESEWDQ